MLEPSIDYRFVSNEFIDFFVENYDERAEVLDGYDPTDFLNIVPIIDTQITLPDNPTGFDYTVSVINQAGADGDTVFNDVLALTETALNILSSFISAVAGTSLDVAVTIEQLGTSTVASAGPGDFFIGDTDPDTGLVEILTASQIELTEGVDINGENPDILVSVNSDFLLDPAAFFETDPDRVVPTNSIDFVSVLVHEIIHGLGFFAFRDNTGQDVLFDVDGDGALEAIESSYGLNVDFSFEDGFLTPRFSGDTVVDIYGEAVVLESTFNDPGSDISHFAQVNPDGTLADTFFSIENPSVVGGDVTTIGALTLAVLQDIGYDVNIPDDLGLVNIPDGLSFIPTITSTEIVQDFVENTFAVAVNLDEASILLNIPSSVGIEVIAGDGTTTQTARIRYGTNDEQAFLFLDEDFLIAHDASGNDTVSVRLFFPAQIAFDDGSTEQNFSLDLSVILPAPEATPNDDLLIGTFLDDEINGLAGDDILNGLEGDDILNGSSGDDIINGGFGSDTLSGGTGNDTINANNQSSSSANNLDDIVIESSLILNNGVNDLSNFLIIVEETSNLIAFTGVGAEGDGVASSFDTELFLFAINPDGTLGSLVTFNDDGLAPRGSGLDSLLTASGIAAGNYLLVAGAFDLTETEARSGVEDLAFASGPFQVTIQGANFATEVASGPVDPAALLDEISAAENIVATSLDMNILNGNAGNDTLIGDAGNDTLIGGDGDDILDGGAGRDSLSGGNDNDTLNGGFGNDTLNGQAGDDILNGDDGVDRLTGAAGNDDLDGGAGDDLLLGGAGDDTLAGGDGEDTIVGNAGIDMLFGGNDDDFLVGGANDDTLNGQNGDDTLSGQTGSDTLNGGAGNDNLIGGSGNDTLNGGTDDDMLSGNLGNDTLNGAAGADTLNGAAGNDILNGGAGDDVLLGGGDNDSLNGSSGNDTLDGQAGVDLIDGGLGNDILTGGGGADTFIFADNQGNDSVTDFVNNVDLIDLSLVSDITSFADLEIGLNAQGQATITLDVNQVITLENVTNIAVLDATDFIF